MKPSVLPGSSIFPVEQTDAKSTPAHFLLSAGASAECLAQLRFSPKQSFEGHLVVSVSDLRLLPFFRGSADVY